MSDTPNKPEIWYCKDLAQKLKLEAASMCKGFEGTPKLAIITVGEDPASQVYVRNKKKDCEEIGFAWDHIILPETASTDDVLDAIDYTDAHGIIMQLPVPDQIDVNEVTNHIPQFKDVDCFRLDNLGRVVIGDNPLFLPCTPAGVMAILEEHGVDLVGKNVVVIGRSNIVGKPLANMLINAGAATTCLNSKCELPLYLYDADVIISAAGVRGLIKPEHISKNTVIIDVGINVDETGKLCGDVDKSCYENSSARAITPVPGGVGLMTRAILMQNVAKAFCFANV